MIGIVTALSAAGAPGASWPSAVGVAASVKPRGECGVTATEGGTAEPETMTAGIEAEAASGANPSVNVSPLVRCKSTAPLGSTSLRLFSVESAVSTPGVWFFSLSIQNGRNLLN